MTTLRLAALAALALAGCSQTAGNQADTAANVTAPTGNYIAQIDALGAPQRQLVLFRAIRDAGEDCQNTTKVERLPDLEGRALWRVTCRGGGQFAVQIGNDGVANVTAPKAP